MRRPAKSGFAPVPAVRGVCRREHSARSVHERQLAENLGETACSFSVRFRTALVPTPGCCGSAPVVAKAERYPLTLVTCPPDTAYSSSPGRAGAATGRRSALPWRANHRSQDFSRGAAQANRYCLCLPSARQRRLAACSAARCRGRTIAQEPMSTMTSESAPPSRAQDGETVSRSTKTSSKPAAAAMAERMAMER